MEPNEKQLVYEIITSLATLRISLKVIEENTTDKDIQDTIIPECQNLVDHILIGIMKLTGLNKKEVINNGE